MWSTPFCSVHWFECDFLINCYTFSEATAILIVPGIDHLERCSLRIGFLSFCEWAVAPADFWSWRPQQLPERGIMRTENLIQFDQSNRDLSHFSSISHLASFLSLSSQLSAPSLFPSISGPPSTSSISLNWSYHQPTFSSGRPS